jgi:hypothetical protein
MSSLVRRILDLVRRGNADLRQEVAALGAQVQRQAAMTERLLVLLGEVRAAQVAGAGGEGLAGSEFRAFSQFGDDGIISRLIDIVRPEAEAFVEFGVESYIEANTRYLLLSRNWRGLVMDGSEENISRIHQSDLVWRHDLTARAAFVTAENVNELLTSSGFSGRLGLLHIDIDGNDYWVWKAVTCCDPAIVIVEYNSGFGPERAITVPYAADFFRTKAHSSNLYYGASLRALADLADAKGYDFVGCNRAGNNAYFVKRPLPGGLRALSVNEGYVQSRFRETRGESGELLLKTSREALELIRGMPVVNTRTGQVETL